MKTLRLAVFMLAAISAQAQTFNYTTADATSQSDFIAAGIGSTDLAGQAGGCLSTHINTTPDSPEGAIIGFMTTPSFMSGTYGNCAGGTATLIQGTATLAHALNAGTTYYIFTQAISLDWNETIDYTIGGATST